MRPRRARNSVPSGCRWRPAHENDGAQRAGLVYLQFNCAAAAFSRGGIGLHFEAGEGLGPRWTLGEDYILHGEKALTRHAKTQGTGIHQNAVCVLRDLHLLRRLRRWVRGYSEVERLGKVAGQVGLEVDQQPFDAAVGPVGEGALLGGQGLRRRLR